jgi:SAM-dependent methyltransferase
LKSSVIKPNQFADSEDFEFSALQEARFYRKAIVQEFLPYLNGKVIDMGAGIGQMTALFAEIVGRENLCGVEPDSRFASIFRKNYPNISLIEKTASTLPVGTFCDVITSVNVLEHIDNHVAELSEYRRLLAPSGGHLCLLVPARPEIFSPIDQDFGHFRRYTPSSISKALQSAGLTVQKLFYFNFLGYFAWLINFKILESRSFNPLVVRTFDRFIFRWMNMLEKGVARPPIGQSLVVISRAI